MTATFRGRGLHSFICDEYKCEMRVLSSEKRSDGVLWVKGVAATSDQVNGEIFTPEILERDGYTMRGMPIVYNHSDWPFELKVADIIGVVTNTWWEGDREALMFEGEVFDDKAIDIMERGIVINFSAGYCWEFNVREDGIKISEKINFSHLGFLTDPADIRSQIEELMKIDRDENGIMDIEYVDTFDYTSLRSIKKANTIMRQGYEYAKRNGKWGSRSKSDIIAERANAMERMMEMGEAIHIKDDIDRETLEHIRGVRLSKISDILQDIYEISKPLDDVDTTRMVKKIGDSWCVVHGHPQDPDSPTDKPIGTPIKCYSIVEFGEEEAKKMALALHAAIFLSQDRTNGEGPFAAGPGGLCVCPDCGYEVEHDRNKSCMEMICPKCGSKLIRKDTETERAVGGTMEDKKDPKKDLENEEVDGEEEEEVEEEDLQEEKKEPKSSEDEEGNSEESNEDSEEENSEAKSEEDEEEEESKEESEEDTNEEESEEETEEDRAADYVSTKANLEAALRSCGSEDDEKSSAIRKALEEVEKELKPPESDEVRKLKSELADSTRKLAQFEATERDRKISERVEDLLKDKSFAPKARKKLTTIISSMDDDAYDSFRALAKDRKAYSTDERGVTTEGKEKDGSESDEEKDPYKQSIT